MKRAWMAVLAGVAVMATGCAVGPKYKTPVVPAPAAYKEGPWGPAQPSDAIERGKWWQIYHDPDLDALEEQVDVSNQDLRAAAARFDQARALIGVSRAAGRPNFNFGGNLSTNRASANTITATSGNTSNYGNLVMPADFSWEIDLFGRIRHLVEAARTEAQASAADYESVRLSLHAELAYDYFELRSLDAQKQLLDSTVVAYQKALDLTRNRFEGGAAAGAEVAQAETQLESTRAQDQDVTVLRAQYEHALAALTGKAPSDFSLAPKPLTVPPPDIPEGVPSELLERRPDIAAAERRVAAANERVGFAHAAYYPGVMLTAAVGLQGSSFTNWLNWPSRFWAVGPSLLQTVFDGGLRRAQLQAAQFGYDQAVASYRQTTLDAFQQVEDNLAAERVLSQEAETQRKAVAAAERSLELSMNRYTGGLVTYLEVVTAQSVALANERTAVDILRHRMEASVLLVKALGGGWDRSKLPALRSS